MLLIIIFVCVRDAQIPKPGLDPGPAPAPGPALDPVMIFVFNLPLAPGPVLGLNPGLGLAPGTGKPMILLHIKSFQCSNTFQLRNLFHIIHIYIYIFIFTGPAFTVFPHIHIELMSADGSPMFSIVKPSPNV